MKPNFALSLSHEGIRLLHRQEDGWLLVGAVPLDSPDLALALADLRQQGRALTPVTMTSAIIVPADQIRFLALPGAGAVTGAGDAAAHDAAARAALDGATPYPVAELAYDVQDSGGTLHVAAVARETLAEAETFAADHGFGPVSFMSEAQATGFPAGAFFGPTRIAPRLIPPGDTVARETVPDSGGAPEPAAVKPSPAATPDVTASAAEAPVAEAEPAATPQPEPESAAEPAPEALPEPVSTAVAEPALALEPPAAEATGADAAPAVSPEPPAEPAADAPPVVFASRARPVRAVTEMPVAPPAVILTAGPVAQAPDDGAEPVFAHRKPAADAPVGIPAAPDMRAETVPGAGPVAGPDGGPGTGPGTAPDTGPDTGPPADVGVGAPAQLLDPELDPGLARNPAPAARVLAGDPAASPPAPAATPMAAGVRPAPPASPAAPRASKADVPPLVAKRLAAPSWARIEAPETATAAPSRPARATTEPGASRRPRLRLGLVLTGVLLLALLLVALWSTSLGTGLAGLFGRGSATTATDIAAAPDPAPESADLADAATAAQPAPLPAEVAAPGAAADLPGEVPETPLDSAEVAAAATAVAGGFVTPEEADRIYAATGVWLRAPRLPLVPQSDDLTTLSTGTGDAAPTDPAVAALPSGPGLAPDAGLPTQPVPPAAGASFPRDARGLILATPEGTLLPNGATVFAAAPPLVPPTRPGTPAPAPDVAADAAAAIESLGIRPAARPDTVLAAAIAAGLATAPDPAADAPDALAADAAAALAGTAPTAGAVSLAGLRPAARPSYMVPPAPWEGPAPPNRPATLEVPEGAVPAAGTEAAPETETPPPGTDLDATLLAIVAGAPDPLAGVTAQAVPQARRPDARPRNFESVVQTQLERLARAQAQQQEQLAAAAAPAPAAAPAAAPQTGGVGTGALSQEEVAEAAPEISSGDTLPTAAIPGSVAQNATLAGAINLNDVNVIGVFGTQSNRRALVRLANGRILQVRVGDTLDGGQVVAIGDSFVNYTRRGQTVTLNIPG